MNYYYLCISNCQILVIVIKYSTSTTSNYSTNYEMCLRCVARVTKFVKLILFNSVLVKYFLILL